VADAELISLSEDTTPNNDDWMYGVDSTGTTDKKYSVDNLANSSAFSTRYAPLTARNFAKIRRGGGDITGLTATTMTAIHSTDLGYQNLTLAVGDVVRLEFLAEGFIAASTAVLGIDFEVDQPTSANVFASGGGDYGVSNLLVDTNRRVIPAWTYFEAGGHGFRPTYRLSSATNALTIANATSGTGEVDISFSGQNWGAAPLA
jgi:hypothetical protein